MRTVDFDFPLPEELIAQHPADQRDQSRLLTMNRATGEIRHQCFADLTDWLHPGDVLVLNNSRVIPARIRGQKPDSGGKVEMLLVEENATNDWWAMLKPGKRVRPGTRITLNDRKQNPTALIAEVIAKNDEGHCRIVFSGTENILTDLDIIGETPLPPYITRDSTADNEQDIGRYQTVYAEPRGSAAAPTAGLHFTPELLKRIKAKGVHVHFVTLHVGLGTFAPVKVEDIEKHKMHEERFELPEPTARAINQAKAGGNRIFAVGTTTVRVLESVASQWVTQNHDSDPTHLPLPEATTRGQTSIFIYPPRDFRIVDALVTNFHLPQSTLLMLVSAFVSPGKLEGRETILNAYATAVQERYRFFSYGDAMLIT